MADVGIHIIGMVGGMLIKIHGFLQRGNESAKHRRTGKQIIQFRIHKKAGQHHIGRFVSFRKQKLCVRGHFASVSVIPA